MAEILFKEESYRIIGACMEVHRNLGPGFLEPVYQESLEHEMKVQKITFQRQQKLDLFYNGTKLQKYYVADFVCFGQIIMEIKAINFLNQLSCSQLVNYLKATNFQLGLLVNFGERSLNYRRFINTISRNSF